MSAWSTRESEELYNVPVWGDPFFSIDERGHLVVTPEGREGGQVDLPELIGQIRRRGVAAPILLRFDGILRARARQLNAAFNNARREYDYRAPYRGVFPIKVNQERHVVEALLAEGRSYGMGLEVGSKPELIAGIERGVFMETNRSWSIDDSRNKFQFGCEYGRLIEDGRLTTVVRNPNYRGISANFWRSLTGVGDRDTFEVMGTPNCGKGEPNQVIRVGHASPTCLFADVEVFGGA